MHMTTTQFIISFLLNVSIKSNTKCYRQTSFACFIVVGAIANTDVVGNVIEAYTGIDVLVYLKMFQ